MTVFRTRCAALAALVVVLTSIAPAAQPQASMAELVGNYADWIYDRRPTVELGIIDLDAARRELARLDPGAIVVDATVPPERQREIRRRVLTAFALEVAALGSIKHASSAGRLVEWACAYVRSHAPLNDYDRAWQRAALSVLEGAIDSHALAEHVDHALPVFHDEPRLILARGIVEEQFNAPNEALVRTPTATGLLRAREALVRMEGESYRASERAVAKFQEAAKHDSVRAEAILRAGHVQLRLGRYDAALATWAPIERDVTDRALLFLLHLFRGQALEGRARIDEARRSYEAALTISPGAHSATLRLAALSFRYGHGAEAAPLSDALLRDDDPRRDPWWSYYAADWRLYYPHVDRVRVLVKQP